MSRYSLSPVQHIVQQHGRGEILARKVKAYSFFYLLDAKAAPFMCRLISLARQGGGRQFPSCSNPQLWRCLLESEHSLFQPTDKGAHPTSKLGCLPSCSVSSKISKGNRANKYVERVCSVCGKRQNNPPRTYAQSIAVAPTLGMRTSGCISLIFFHRPSVSTELGVGDRKLPPHGKHACSVVHAGAKASGGAISGIATHSQCDQG